MVGLVPGAPVRKPDPLPVAQSQQRSDQRPVGRQRRRSDRARARLRTRLLAARWSPRGPCRDAGDVDDGHESAAAALLGGNRGQLLSDSSEREARWAATLAAALANTPARRRPRTGL